MPTKRKQKRKPNFSRMSDAQKRVIAAKDVLAALDAKQYRATQCLYMSFSKRDAYALAPASATEAQRVLQKARHCRVCAVGAAALSCVRKFDGWDGRDIYGPAAFRIAAPIFGKARLALMEAAFEQQVIHYVSGPVLRAFAFGKRRADPSARLRAIFRNVVQNKGDFKP